ncbi:hypothetical protein QYM36_018269 [Artemia franciscana]|uniref:Peptidase C1A papain C-terminal domain-containing protein n=1 Tax=Artemia franciscana TaxID=6661 RepID=A0AA88HCU0_ARTSF|nr:hypothetical protein QYM36_018269 [Artemia franciscana]
MKCAIFLGFILAFCYGQRRVINESNDCPRCYGGIFSIKNLEDETVVGMANFALSTLDAYDHHDNKRVLSKIIKGTREEDLRQKTIILIRVVEGRNEVSILSDFLEISQDEEEIAQWLAENGPVIVGINANVMQFYRRGVSHPFCNPKNLDHGVLIVGYGTEIIPVKQRVLPYLIVKNSLETRWGEQVVLNGVMAHAE